MDQLVNPTYHPFGFSFHFWPLFISLANLWLDGGHPQSPGGVDTPAPAGEDPVGDAREREQEGDGKSGQGFLERSRGLESRVRRDPLRAA